MRRTFKPNRTKIVERAAPDLEIVWTGGQRGYLWVGAAVNGRRSECLFHMTTASARQLRDWLTENLEGTS